MLLSEMKTASKSWYSFQISIALSSPVTKRPVDNASAYAPLSAITVTDIKPLSAGYPVCGSIM